VKKVVVQKSTVLFVYVGVICDLCSWAENPQKRDLEKISSTSRVGVNEKQNKSGE